MECASIGPEFKLLVAIPLHSSNLEVYKFDMALILVIENIFGFDVTMADSLFVEIEDAVE